MGFGKISEVGMTVFRGIYKSRFKKMPRGLNEENLQNKFRLRKTHLFLFQSLS